MKNAKNMRNNIRSTEKGVEMNKGVKMSKSNATSGAHGTAHNVAGHAAATAALPKQRMHVLAAVLAAVLALVVAAVGLAPAFATDGDGSLPVSGQTSFSTGENIDWRIEADGTLVLGKAGEDQTLATGWTGTSGTQSAWPWLDDAYRGQITGVKVEGTIKAQGSINHMFNGLGDGNPLGTIDLTGLDTSDVTIIRNLFTGVKAKVLNIGSCDLNKVGSQPGVSGWPAHNFESFLNTTFNEMILPSYTATSASGGNGSGNFFGYSSVSGGNTRPWVKVAGTGAVTNTTSADVPTRTIGQVATLRGADLAGTWVTKNEVSIVKQDEKGYALPGAQITTTTKGHFTIEHDFESTRVPEQHVYIFGNDELIITEAEVPTGYDPAVKNTSTTVTLDATGKAEGYTDNLVTVTNYPLGNVTVTKIWDDDGAEVTHDEDVVLTLSSNLSGATPYKTDAYTDATDTAHTSDAWETDLNNPNKKTYTFKNLPLYNTETGEKLTYTVDEEDVPDGYVKSVSGLTVTNTTEDKMQDITVTKLWNDLDSEANSRPAINLTLTGNDKQEFTYTSTKDAAAPEISNNGKTWTYTFKVAMYDGGSPITYVLTEDPVAGYTSTVNGFNIVNNSNNVEPIDPPGTKQQDPSGKTTYTQQSTPDRLQTFGDKNEPENTKNITEKMFNYVVDNYDPENQEYFIPTKDAVWTDDTKDHADIIMSYKEPIHPVFFYGSLCDGHELDATKLINQLNAVAKEADVTYFLEGIDYLPPATITDQNGNPRTAVYANATSDRRTPVSTAETRTGTIERNGTLDTDTQNFIKEQMDNRKYVGKHATIRAFAEDIVDSLKDLPDEKKPAQIILSFDYWAWAACAASLEGPMADDIKLFREAAELLQEYYEDGKVIWLTGESDASMPFGTQRKLRLSSDLNNKNVTNLSRLNTQDRAAWTYYLYPDSGKDFELEPEAIPRQVEGLNGMQDFNDSASDLARYILGHYLVGGDSSISYYSGLPSGITQQKYDYTQQEGTVKYTTAQEWGSGDVRVWGTPAQGGSLGRHDYAGGAGGKPFFLLDDVREYYTLSKRMAFYQYALLNPAMFLQVTEDYENPANWDIPHIDDWMLATYEGKPWREYVDTLSYSATTTAQVLAEKNKQYNRYTITDTLNDGLVIAPDDNNNPPVEFWYYKGDPDETKRVDEGSLANLTPGTQEYTDMQDEIKAAYANDEYWEKLTLGTDYTFSPSTDRKSFTVKTTDSANALAACNTRIKLVVHTECKNKESDSTFLPLYVDNNPPQSPRDTNNDAEGKLTFITTHEDASGVIPVSTTTVDSPELRKSFPRTVITAEKEWKDDHGNALTETETWPGDIILHVSRADDPSKADVLPPQKITGFGQTVTWGNLVKYSDVNGKEVPDIENYLHRYKEDKVDPDKEIEYVVWEELVPPAEADSYIQSSRLVSHSIMRKANGIIEYETEGYKLTNEEKPKVRLVKVWEGDTPSMRPDELATKLLVKKHKTYEDAVTISTQVYAGTDAQGAAGTGAGEKDGTFTIKNTYSAKENNTISSWKLTDSSGKTIASGTGLAYGQSASQDVQNEVESTQTYGYEFAGCKLEVQFADGESLSYVLPTAKMTDRKLKLVSTHETEVVTLDLTPKASDWDKTTLAAENKWVYEGSLAEQGILEVLGYELVPEGYAISGTGTEDNPVTFTYHDEGADKGYYTAEITNKPAAAGTVKLRVDKVLDGRELNGDTFKFMITSASSEQTDEQSGEQGGEQTGEQSGGQSAEQATEQTATPMPENTTAQATATSGVRTTAADFGIITYTTNDLVAKDVAYGEATDAQKASVVTWTKEETVGDGENATTVVTTYRAGDAIPDDATAVVYENIFTYQIMENPQDGDTGDTKPIKNEEAIRTVEVYVLLDQANNKILVSATKDGDEFVTGQDATTTYDEDGTPVLHTVELELVTFTNVYTSDGTWTPTATKILNGRPLERDQFTFTLDADNTKNEKDADGNEWVTQEAPLPNKAAEAVTNTLQDVEGEGDGTNSLKGPVSFDSVAYTNELLKAKVTYGSADEATRGKVIYWEDTDNSVVYGPIPDGATATVTVDGIESTVTYAEATDAQRKAAEGGTTDSQWTLDGKTYIDPKITGSTATIPAGAEGTFYEDSRTFTYLMWESKAKFGSSNNDIHSTKDKAYVVEVTITEQKDGTLRVDEKVKSSKFDDEGNVATDDDGNVQYEDATTSFTNTYEAKGTVTITANKELTGRELKDEEFEFELSGPGIDGSVKAKNDGAGKITFPEITFTEADLMSGTDYDANRTNDGLYEKSFVYTLKETSTGGNGVTTDSSTITCVVTVREDKDGKISVVAVNGQPTTSNPVNAGTFTNAYQASGSTTITATKNFEGGTLENGMFFFVLKDSDGKVLDEKSNNADGTISFTPIAYTLDDLGGAASKTFTYTVEELVPTGSAAVEDIEYDTSKKTITVTVKDNGDGTLDVTTSPAEGKAGTFTNKTEYKTGDVTVTKKFVDEAGNVLPEGVIPSDFAIDVAYTTAENKALKEETTKVSLSDMTRQSDGTYAFTIKDVVDGTPVHVHEANYRALPGYDFTKTEVVVTGASKQDNHADDANFVMTVPANTGEGGAEDTSGGDSGNTAEPANSGGILGFLGGLFSPMRVVSGESINNDAPVKVTFTNTYKRTTADITLTKVWDDESNHDDNRPENVTFTITATGKPAEDGWTESDGAWIKTVEITGTGDSWTDSSLTGLCTHDDAGKKITYTVDEADVPAGYTKGSVTAASTLEANATKNFSITNSYEPKTATITATKVWAGDNDNKYQMRRATNLYLYADDKLVGEVTPGAVPTQDGTVTTSWTNLPVFKSDGSQIHYTVKEEAVKGYTATYKYGDGTNNYAVINVAEDGTVTADAIEVTNTYAPTFDTLKIIKVWEDGDDVDGYRPTDLEVLVQAENAAGQAVNAFYDGSSTAKAYLSADNTDADGNWVFEWTDESSRPLPTSYDGEPVFYIPVSETFAGANEAAKGDQSKYTHTCIERVSAGEYKITNIHEPETTSATVTKVWSDNNNASGARPATATFTLWKKVGGAEAVATDKTLVLSAADVAATDANTWTGTLEGLPTHELVEGVSQAVVYSWKETAVAGYTANPESLEVVDKGSITNTLITDGFKVTKAWEDGENAEGLRPESVTFHLYKGDGTNTSAGVDAKTITGEGSAEWKDLPVYDASGEKITYTVVEETVAGYTTTPSDLSVQLDGAEGSQELTVTNTLTPATTEVSVTKVWNDNNDTDGKRPESVAIDLYEYVWDSESAAYKKNDTAVTTLTLNAAGDWKATKNELPGTKNGKTVIYEVIEQTAGDVFAAAGTSGKYSNTPCVTGNQVDGFTVTNNYTPETVDINVTKKWEGDVADYRPDHVVIKLLDGEDATGDTLVLVSDGTDTWTGTFKNLPKYKLVDGESTPITYGVEELEIPGYTSAKTGNAADGFTITNTAELGKLQVVKTWDDNGDQDKLRDAAVAALPSALAFKADGKAITTPELDGSASTTGNVTTLTYKDVPIYNASGEKITYTVSEDNIADYELTSPAGDVNANTETPGVLRLTNTHKLGSAEVEITKVWQDNSNADNLRPDVAELTSYFKLLAGEEEVSGVTPVVTLVDNNTYKLTWKNLAATDANGAAITYQVTEELPQNSYYEIEGAATVANGGTITNKCIRESITVDTEDYDGEGNPLFTKSVNMLPPDADEKEFTFILAAQDGAPTPESVVGTATVTEAGEAVAIEGFGTITFTEPGEYTYTLIEQREYGWAATEATSGIELTVNVAADEDGGKLVASVEPVAVTNIYNPVDDQPSSPTDTERGGIELTKSFTGDLVAGQFWFQLEDEEGNIYLGTHDAEGTIQFPAIGFSGPGEYEFTLTEIDGDEPGIVYDTAPRTLTVAVTDDDELDGLFEFAWELTEGEDTFENSEVEAELEVPLPEVKKLVTVEEPNNASRTVAEGDFSFKLIGIDTDIDGANESGSANAELAVTWGEDALSFIQEDLRNDAGSFDESRSFIYTIYEVPGDDSNISYDGTVYTRTLTLSWDEETGELTYAWNDDSEIVFENTYEPSGTPSSPTEGGDTTDGTITVAKELTDANNRGRAPKANEFLFQLELAEAPAGVELVNDSWLATNDGEGNVAFPNIYFETAGTYTFTLRELAGNDETIDTYDETTYTVVATVTDDGEGSLGVVWTVEGGESAVTFKNTTVIETTEVKVHKVWMGDTDDEGNALDVRPDSVSIELQVDGEAATDAEGEAITPLTLDEGNSWTGEFTDLPKYGEDGEPIEYEVAEVEVPDGYESSTAKLLGNCFMVTNVYTPEPVPPISVKTGGGNEDEVAGNADPFFTKAVNEDPGFPPNAESKDFTFVLAAQGDAPAPSTPMVTVTIAETGTQYTLNFGDIEFTTDDLGGADEKTFTYTLVEQQESGWEPNEATSGLDFKLTLTREDDGTLAVSYETQDIVNTYKPIDVNDSTPTGPGENQITLEKDLTGDLELEPGMFRFQLESDDGLGTWFAYNGDAEADDAAPIIFPVIEFAEPGVYTFTLTEFDDEIPGVTYDETATGAGYTITCTVTDDDADGLLEFTWAYGEGFDGTITNDSKIPDDVSVTPGNDSDPEAETAITFAKELSGRTLEADEFEFMLIGPNTKQEASNGEPGADGTGAVEFTEPITFTYNDLRNADGTYEDSRTFTYTVFEKPGDLNNVKYDSTVHEITATLSLVDGELVVEWAEDEIVFENEYEPSGTPSSPTEQDSVTTPITVTKIFTAPAASGQSLKTDTFLFELLDQAGERAALGSNDNGTVHFTPVYFEKPGTYTFTMKEVAGFDSRVTYDPHVYTVVATFSDDGENASVVWAVTEKDGTAIENADDQKKASFTNIFDEKTEVKVLKAWVGDTDADGTLRLTRPESVSVALKAGNAAATDADGTDVEPLTLNAEGNWAGTFTNLPKYDSDGALISYTVVEENVPDGYQVTYKDMAALDTKLVINEYKTAAITGTKTWVDGGKPHNNSADVKLVVKRSTEAEPDWDTVEALSEGTDYHIDWSGEKDAIYTIRGLLEKAPDDAEYQFHVEESPVPDGYTVSYDGYNITNTINQENVTISGTKTWVGGDEDSHVNENLTLTLKRNDQPISVDDAGNNLKVVWDDNTYTFKTENDTGATLNKYDANGAEYTYAVEEVAVEGYDATYDGLNITNTNTEKVTIYAKKVWAADEGDTSKRAEVKLQLSQTVDGATKNVGEAKVATKGQDESFAPLDDLLTWEDLPRFDAAGNAITYTVDEVDVPEGYSKSGPTGDGTQDSPYEITNTLGGNVTSITVSKVWADNDNQDGLRPDDSKVTVTLSAMSAAGNTWDGKDADGNGASQITLEEANNGTARVDNLPKTDANGSPYTYKVEEEPVDGYTPSYSSADGENDSKTDGTIGASNAVTITNTHQPGTMTVTATKVWDDAGVPEAAGLHTDVTLHLYGKNADGKIVYDAGTNTIAKDSTEPARWENLPTNHYSTTPLTWEVVEDSVFGFTSRVEYGYDTTDGIAWAGSISEIPEGSAWNNALRVTNTYAGPTTQVSVAKQWNDDKDVDGKRPATITYELWKKVGTGQEQKVAEKTVDVAATDEGTAEFTWYDLPTVENTPQEVEEHTAQTTEMQEQTVTVYLYGGTEYETRDEAVAAATEAGVVEENMETAVTEQQKTVEVPVTVETSEQVVTREESSAPILYIVKEKPVEHYTSVVEATAPGEFTAINTHERDVQDITVQKTWDDGDNADGMRPDHITFTLSSDGTIIHAGKDSIKGTIVGDGSVTFHDLPVNKDGGKGVAADYTVEEDEVVGYAPTITTSADGKTFTILNTHTQAGKVGVKATKVWQGDDADKSTRQDVVLKLIQVDISTGSRSDMRANKTIAANTNVAAGESAGVAEWTDLPTVVGGKNVTYTVEETAVPGYTTTYSDATLVDGAWTVTVTNEAKKITVTYETTDPESGEVTVIEKEVIDRGGNEPAQPADPTRDSYTFGGWDRTVDSEGNVTYEARWTPIERVTVVYIDPATGEKIVDEIINRDSNEPKPPAADPTREGYIFGGWQRTEDENGNVIYEAKWIPEPDPGEISVTYKDGNNTIDANVITRGDDEPDQPANPTKEGYTFGGWLRSMDDDGNVIYTANWIENAPPEKPRVVYLDPKATDGSMIMSSKDYDNDAAAAAAARGLVDAPLNPAHDGYDFVGWAINQDENGDWILVAKYNEKASEEAPKVVSYIDPQTGELIVSEITSDVNSVNRPDAPSHDNLKFVGWEEVVDANGNHIFVAKYEADCANTAGETKTVTETKVVKESSGTSASSKSGGVTPAPQAVGKALAKTGDSVPLAPLAILPAAAALLAITARSFTRRRS